MRTSSSESSAMRTRKGLSGTPTTSAVFSNLIGFSVRCGRSLCQGEAKSRALIHLPLGPDSAVMPLNDSLDSGQANAGAAKLALIVQPLEWAEQMFRPGHVEPSPVVAQKIGSRAVALG